MAFLVEDLEVAARRWRAVYRDEEWRTYTYTPDVMKNCTYRGEPGRYEMRLALVGSSPQLELIQPIAGPSIYHDWIREHGYGLHHFGFFVPSVDETVRQLEAQGHPSIQSGSGYGLDGDGGYAYFDFEDTYGVVLEAIGVPKRRRPSEQIFDSTNNVDQTQE
ncbi:VOC family protein [Micromonospora fulviviridis]|uniref:VOC family protein n=1 Tax=Micromonospora fulviviridis TaxID=47860 RepID=A0ABV2VTV6_9ACTN